MKNFFNATIIKFMMFDLVMTASLIHFNYQKLALSYVVLSLLMYAAYNKINAMSTQVNQ